MGNDKYIDGVHNVKSDGDMDLTFHRHSVYLENEAISLKDNDYMKEDFNISIMHEDNSQSCKYYQNHAVELTDNDGCSKRQRVKQFLQKFQADIPKAHNYQ